MNWLDEESPTYNVYGWQVGRAGLGLNAAYAIRAACHEIGTDVEGEPGEHGWLAQAINDLRKPGASVRLERQDGRWVRIVRAS